MRLDAPLSAALVAACLVTVGCAPRPRAPRGPLARAQDTLAEAHVERTGKASDRATLTAALGEADLVCVGEQHDEVTHHRLQHALFLTLLEQDDRARRPLALGLEMVARDFQPLLDAYSRGELTTAELPRALDWKRRWGFRFGMYAPLLHTAHASGTRLIGLNAPRAITRTVARRGLRALPHATRKSLPELVLDDRDHRAFFDGMMRAAGPHGRSGKHAPSPKHGKPGPKRHGKPHGARRHHHHHHGGHGHRARRPRVDDFYTAQVIWDETMAESAAAWLGPPGGRQMLVLAGNGHCHESAIVRRAERRTPGLRAVAVQVVSGDAPLPDHVQADFVVRLPERSAAPTLRAAVPKRGVDDVFGADGVAIAAKRRLP